MNLSIRTADRPTMHLLDGLVVCWLVLWLVVGAASGYTIWKVSGLGDTVSSSGRALDSAGRALESVGSVPVIGERPAELGSQVIGTAAEIQSRGQEVKSQLRQLSLLLGLSIMLMPTTPVLGLYLPLRLARKREVSQLRSLLERDGRDPVVDRYLAERALHSLPFTSVRAVTRDPWRDLAEGHTSSLADAELHRLGLLRPPR